MSIENGNKKNIINNDSEFGVDSRYKTKKEREQDSLVLMEARLARMKNLPKEQILRARLLQLKLKMEDYLKNLSMIIKIILLNS